MPRLQDKVVRSRSFAEQWFGTTPTAGVALKRGALFRDDSRRINGEVQYNNNFGGFDVVIGTQYQRDMANSNNTYLFDRECDIIINQVGVYTQIEKELPANFKVIAAASRRPARPLRLQLYSKSGPGLDQK
ncbi:hypothetical protein H8B13_02940 [Hymenobacter sp. BT188]|uniref:hypothetical protein n=1 Tax=Hymenobacter sp. BT188 TaxID=2763504 RepID=UPI001651720E|nr:hypothetical protein [Hymenobacter sp. BT188]MBC6605763.1 hypothetical protein [Hymenobacter sp. BT188]